MDRKEYNVPTGDLPVVLVTVVRPCGGVLRASVLLVLVAALQILPTSAPVLAAGSGLGQAQDDGAIAGADSLTAPLQSSASDSLTPADTAVVAAASDSLAAAALTQLEPADLWDTGISSTAAVLMTPVFPGWGQLYVESSWRGMLAFGVEWFYWSNMISKDRQARRARDFGATVAPGQLQDYYNTLADEYWEQMRDFAWWSAGVLMIIALDAYVGAKLFHFDEEPLPVPNDWSEHFGANAPLPPGGRDPLSMVVFRWRKTF